MESFGVICIEKAKYRVSVPGLYAKETEMTAKRGASRFADPATDPRRKSHLKFPLAFERIGGHPYAYL